MRKCLVLLTVCIYSSFSIAQNVGIGVSNPQNKLHVGGGFRLDTLTGVGGAGLLRHDANGVVYGIKFSGNIGDVLRGDGTFGSGGAGSVGWLLTGNSGTDPATNFLGTSDNQPLRFKVNNLWAGEIHPTSGNIFLGVNAGLANTTGSLNTALGLGADVSAGNLTNATAIGANAVANASNQVMLGSSSVSSVRMQTASLIARYLEFVKTGATNDWRFEHSSSGRYLYISSSTNDFSGFADRAYFDTAVSSGYVFHVLGKSVGSSWVASDAKLKKDITSFTGAMDIINKLKPKTYFYKRADFSYLNLPPEKQYGLIAQDLEAVLPELVTTANMPVKVANGERQVVEIKTVNYSELIPVLIKGLQEQQIIIEDQNKKIEKQQKQIDDLIKRIEALEKK
jgi:hypothetical protein